MLFPDIDWLIRINQEVEALVSFIPIKSINLKVTGAFMLLMSDYSVGRSECWRSEQAKKRFSCRVDRRLLLYSLVSFSTRLPGAGHLPLAKGHRLWFPYLRRK